MKKNQNNIETMLKSETDTPSEVVTNSVSSDVGVTNNKEEKISKVPVFLLLLIVILIGVGMYFLKGGIEDVFQTQEPVENTQSVQVEFSHDVDPEISDTLDGVINNAKADANR